MIRPIRAGVVLAGVVGIMCAIAATASHGESAATTSQPASTQPIAKPAFAAMNYYDQSCANCHGPQGSFYGPTLGADLDDAGLVKICRDMAAGPAQAPITESENEVETAFHRSLVMRNPYLAVTQIDATKWSGEVMPDSKVTLTIADKKIEAKVESWNWSAELPAETKIADVTIQADLKGKTTTIKPSESMHSNTAPVPPPADRKPQ